ncbi:ribonucleotide reductase subunit 1 [macacine betaherpesvirus 9]|uniref:Ribonucleotide reductase subunit 1 n=1 Tax=macacine betaherpesvirus 9 TaxID=2560568 RepID=A0A192XNN9_9BETA|nr:ribonucleotide reductase subunit 1 [macacine betaherpesvirus 9]ANC96527.1 ribonucleotide reductase subunit 1 [macacine betaherpesvirus 9]
MSNKSILNHGMGLSRKCFCHQEISKKRFCYSRFYFKTLLYKQLYDISKIMQKLNSSLDAWFLRDTIISSLGATHNAPYIDRLLGKFYLKTNLDSEYDPMVLFLGSGNILQQSIIDFVNANKIEIAKVIQDIKNTWIARFSPGVLAASRFLDEISNSFNGIEESVPAIFLRVSATLANQIQKTKYLNQTWHEAFFFEELIQLFSHGVCTLSSPCFGNLGLKADRNSVFDTVFYNISNYSLEDFLFFNNNFFLPAMLNGSYVSVNLTRYHHEAESLLELLLSQMQIIEKDTNKTTGLTVYIEVWHLSLLMWLDLCEILPENIQINFCVVIPGIFMDRAKNTDSYWSVFQKSVATDLGLYNEQSFTLKYLEYEKTVEHARIKTEVLIDNICRCMRKGKMGLIFRKNICDYSVLPQIPSYCLGNSMDIIPFEYGLNACFRVILNVTSFVDNNVDENMVQNFDFAQFNGKFFNLKRMRQIVTKLIIIANSVIDYAVENNDIFMDGIIEARSVAICITGLHSVFMVMGLAFNEQSSRDLYRIICEQIYYSCLRASVDCCINGAEPCKLFEKSKYAQGILHCDLYENVIYTLPNCLWEVLRTDIQKYGLRNLAFVSGSAMEREFDLTNCSAAYWPIEGNKILRRSNIKVLHPSTVLHCDTSVYSTELQTLYIPVYNTQFLKKFKKHLDYLSSFCYNVAEITGKEFTEEEMKEMRLFNNGFAYSMKDMFEMYSVALPFTDHGQSNIFFVNDLEHIKDVLISMYDNGFKTGIFKVVCKKEFYKTINPCKKFDLLGGYSDGVVMHAMHVFQ